MKKNKTFKTLACFVPTSNATAQVLDVDSKCHQADFPRPLHQHLGPSLEESADRAVIEHDLLTFKDCPETRVRFLVGHGDEGSRTAQRRGFPSHILTYINYINVASY